MSGIIKANFKEKTWKIGREIKRKAEISPESPKSVFDIIRRNNWENEERVKKERREKNERISRTL